MRNMITILSLMVLVGTEVFAAAIAAGWALAGLFDLGDTVGHILMALFSLLAANPARLLGVNAGRLIAGAEADLILIDADRPWQIDSRAMPGRAGNTPFDGLPVQGRVGAVWKGGRRLA